MEDLNPAYLAGVFDSDGSFTVARRHPKRLVPNYTAMIQLTWKSSNLTIAFMEALVSQYGGSYAPCKSTNTHRSFQDTADYLKFSATGVAAERIATAVLPFLMLKKTQAENIIKLRALVNSYVRVRPIEVSKKLEELYDLNKSLNSKNGWKNETENNLRRS